MPSGRQSAGWTGAGGLAAAVPPARLPAGADARAVLLATPAVALHIALGLPVAAVVAFLGRLCAAIEAVVGACAGFHAFDLGPHMVLPFRTHARHFPCARGRQAACIAHIPAIGPAMLPERDLCMADSIEAEQ